MGSLPFVRVQPLASISVFQASPQASLICLPRVPLGFMVSRSPIWRVGGGGGAAGLG